MVRWKNSCLFVSMLVVLVWNESAFAAEIGKAPKKLEGSGVESFHRKALSNISDILEKETTIATKTSLNADYVPGMVTVLYGEDLEKRGARTVREALDLVPGWDNSFRLVVRGVEDVLAPTKIKIMLNGVPMNATTCGATFIMNMAVEMVKRIEIIRGPGSAIYGKWACLGAVNIVTHSTSNRIFGRTGSFDNRAGGVQLSFTQPSDQFAMSLNASTWERDRSDIVAGRDSLYGTQNRRFSKAPGQVNDSKEVSNAVFSMTFHNISLLGQTFRYGEGSMFGAADALPPLEDRKTEFQDADTIDLRWAAASSRAYKIDIYGGWRQAMWDLDDRYLYPPRVNGYENGIILGPHYKENNYRGGTDIHLRLFQKHEALLGIEYEFTKLLDVWADGNVNPITFLPVETARRFQGADNWLEEDQEQRIFSVLLQDQYKFTDALTLTGGGRYDRYSDQDERFSPRLAAVYALTDQHIFKLQYAEAFRPPTLIETYSKSNVFIRGNHDIESEIIKTSEAGYAFIGDAVEARLTVFHSDLVDTIMIIENQWRNGGKAESNGAELEGKWAVFQDVTIDGNVSYVDTEEQATGEQLAGAAHWLGNAGVQYELVQDYTLALQYHYVGERFRAAWDNRSPLEPSGRIDGTISIKRFLVSGLTLRTGVRNLLDEDIRQLCSSGGYASDYPTPGREWWVLASLKF